MGARSKSPMVEKKKKGKVEKWKSVKLPESLWHRIKVIATAEDVFFFEAIGKRFEDEKPK